MERNKHSGRLNKNGRIPGAVSKHGTVYQDPNQVTMQVEGIPCGLEENADKAKNTPPRGALKRLNENRMQKRPETPKKQAKKPARREKLKKKTKKRHESICSSKVPERPPSPAGSDGGAAAMLPELKISEDFWADERKRVEGTPDSSNHPNVQGIICPEEMNPGNGSSEKKILRSKSEFQLQGRLGKGGFGCVHKALQILEGKCYAIKITECKEPRKALREVQALSHLVHHNIIRYHACWMEDSGCVLEHTDDSCSTPCSKSSNESPVQYLYIQLELCDKKTLTDWIAEKNQKETQHSKRSEESLKCILQIVEGVVYIHSKMLIHRDLKPANILFGPDGMVKIGDFGLVTTHYDHDDKNLAKRTAKKGTLSYMAPEQKTENTYDRKVDIFPLGLIYFELLWKINTWTERAAIWKDIRRQKLPAEFAHCFTEVTPNYAEYNLVKEINKTNLSGEICQFELTKSLYCIIRQMLNLEPDKRPEATEVKMHLDQFAASLNSRKLQRQSSKTF